MPKNDGNYSKLHSNAEYRVIIGTALLGKIWRTRQDSNLSAWPAVAISGLEGAFYG